MSGLSPRQDRRTLAQASINMSQSPGSTASVLPSSHLEVGPPKPYSLSLSIHSLSLSLALSLSLSLFSSTYIYIHKHIHTYVHMQLFYTHEYSVSDPQFHGGAFAEPCLACQRLFVSSQIPAISYPGYL